jgi:beta-glucosidase
MASAGSTHKADLRQRLSTLTLTEKVQLLTGVDFWTTYPAPQAGLHKMVLSDGPVGVRGTAWDERFTSLLLPCPSALAATWDPAQLERAGRLLGAQARDKGVHVLLGPTVNIHRSPLGGRHFECYSEDPFLTARLAIGYVTGVQSQGVASTIKHYVGNDSENERMTYDSRIDERTLRELYLAPFEAAVRTAGVWAVMAAYNGVNGASMTDNRRLLTDVLKREWGFDGVVMSDWMATRSTEASANAGLDLVMPGPQGPWGEALVAAVRAGRVDEETVNDKVLRLLRLADRVCALEGTAHTDAVTTPPDAPAQIRDLTTLGIVLLRNNGLLPLDAHSLRRVALIGPNAFSLGVQGGGSAHVNPAHIVTPLEGLRRALGPDATVNLRAGAFTNRTLPTLTADRTRDPETGEPGLRVEFHGADGSLVGAEHRSAARLVLMPGSCPAGTREIAVRALLIAQETGTHHLSVTGIGAFAVRVGAQPETSITLALSGGDLGEALMRPPEHRIAIHLAAGDLTEVALRHTLDPRTPFAAFGVGYQPPRLSDDAEMDAAAEAVRQADVAIVIVGTNDEFESEGFDRSTLALPGRQDELVSRIAAANPRTIVVVNAGAPVLMPWAEQVAAVVWAWLPGQEGGDAIADVLAGSAESGGRLPTTFPAAEADCPVLSTAPVNGIIEYAESGLVGYRAYAARGVRPAFPFGHGLGYTTWAYEQVSTSAGDAGGLIVEVALRNTGHRLGREVVQCYLTQSDPPGAEPLRLVGFAAVAAAPGERTTARIAIERRTLSRYEAGDPPTGSGWRVAPGRYRLLIGRSATDHRLFAEVTL